MENETTTKDLSKPVWEKYHFKNGKDYELALANNNGVLVFRDSIFAVSFDNQENEDWSRATSNWKKCSLKPLLEKWWEDNAPDNLKDNYEVSIPEAYNIFPDELLQQKLKGKNKQWEIYKNWRNRLFGDHKKPATTWVWTKTKSPLNPKIVLCVSGHGNLNDIGAGVKAGVVPCLIPIKRKDRKE